MEASDEKQVARQACRQLTARNATMRTNRSEQGIAVAYILAAIALLGLVAFMMAKMSNSNVQLQTAFDSKQTLIRQYQLIRSRVLSCGVAYPAGDNGTGVRVRYPATPVSGNVIDMTCPGQPGANNLWSGAGSVTLRAPPAAFTGWMYANDGTSMRLAIQPAVSGDTRSIGILTSVANRIGDIATVSGSTLTITLMN